MKRITIAEQNALILARCANCFELIGARNTPPDLILMGLGGKGNAVQFFYHQPGETDQQLRDRLIWSVKLLNIASGGRRVRIECLYNESADSRVWFDSPLGAPLQ